MARIIGTHQNKPLSCHFFLRHTLGLEVKLDPCWANAVPLGCTHSLYYVTFYLRLSITVFQPLKQFSLNWLYLQLFKGDFTDWPCKTPLWCVKESLMKTLKLGKRQHRDKLVICWCLTISVMTCVYMKAVCPPTSWLARSSFVQWVALWCIVSLPRPVPGILLTCSVTLYNMWASYSVPQFLVYKPRQLQDCWGSMR